MATLLANMNCPSCGSPIGAPTKTTFLGFRKASCAACGAHCTLPLTSGYRTTYIVVLLAMIVGFIFAYQRTGQVMMPGFIGIAVIVALVRDAWLRFHRTV